MVRGKKPINERPNIRLIGFKSGCDPYGVVMMLGVVGSPGSKDPGDTFNPHFSTTLEGSHPVIL